MQTTGVLVDSLEITFGVPVLNRRNFLKAGVTAGAGVVPLTSALSPLEAMLPSSAAQEATSDTNGSSVELVSLPRRLPPLDQSTVPWQQNIRRVGQTNMTEDDPAVMK